MSRPALSRTALSRPRPAVVALVGTALLAGLLTSPAATVAAAPPPTAQLPIAKPVGLPHVSTPTTVTLVTGDKVTLAPDPDGTMQVQLQPVARPNGYTPGMQMVQTNAEQLAVPDDALPYLSAGVLDRTLFDVGYLVSNGYADNATTQLPVITQLSSAVPAAKLRNQADALPGLSPTVQLNSVHATAADVSKSQAGSFWSSIAGAAVPRTGRPVPRAFGRSVTHVWLDRKLKATLDQSVPMIGAPQAWAAGYDGKGVKVAVLDTGIDANHADLKGRVTASKNFTSDPDISDGYGHGTHVASIITGSGAASGGKYKGVAPGVDLLVGKVLNNKGFGEDSDIIAGMEWAAAQGAKVINMSLGGTPTADEADDVGALAVDRITAATGALFVVAAGNNGLSGASTVSTPGVAESALTVASVDKSDKLAYYSSRGPLLYPNRVSKPDISGPGSDIVAARAAGTSLGSPVDANYTSLSGTSMATPHVAGAAAILAQEHPDWQAAQLKAALMSTSKDDGYSTYEQGAGRVDVARAVTQQVSGVTAGVDFGKILETETGDVVRQISYRNDSAGDVTLHLSSVLRSTSGTDLGQAVSVPGQVVVPAHSTASVDVTVHAGQLQDGFSAGAVVASADGVQVRTALALRRSRQSFQVKVNVKFSARPMFGAMINAINLDDHTAKMVLLQRAELAPDGMSGSFSLDLPPGRWSIVVNHDREPASKRLEYVMFAEPELSVQGPVTLSFDDQDAVPYRNVTDGPTQNIAGGMMAYRSTTDGTDGLGVTQLLTKYGDGGFFVAPTKPVTAGAFSLKFNATRALPQVQLAVDSANGRGLSMFPNYSDYAGVAPRFDGRYRKLPVLDVGWSLEPAELAKVRGKLVLMSYTWGHGGYECALHVDDLAALKAAGAVGVLQESGDCDLYPQWVEGNVDLPVAGIDADEGVRLREVLARGPVTVSLTGTPNAPVVYHLAQVSAGRFPDSATYRVRDKDLARVRTSYTPEWQPKQFAGQEGVDSRINAAVESRTLFTWPNYFTSFPQTRDELYGPVGPEVQWIRTVGTDAALRSAEERRTTLRPGRMPDERWLGAPRGIGPSDVPPSATNLTHMGFCFACRDGDRLVVMPEYANPDPLVVASLLVTGTQTKLYRDGQEIPATMYSGFPSFTMPSGPGRYRLVLDSDLNTGPQKSYDLYKYSAKQHTEWTFGSAHVGTANVGNTTCYQAWVEKTAPLTCAPQQLLYVRYSAPTDGTNKVRHGVVPLQLKPYYERTAKTGSAASFRSVKVTASYDGGKSWKPVAGVNLRSSYQALLVAPRGTTTVSLHVEATDLNGNTISQTIDSLLGVR
ncbi:S8 family serine peptidase [Kribbella hippodromi]|uniref:S8 family serine peptidase n=1 Tax=Kribbella hippodromi TaxID=434347 RepID=A0ABP4NWD2_9ACTN